MPIGFITISARNGGTGNFAPGILPLSDIEAVATLGSEEERQKYKGGNGIIYFKKEQYKKKPGTKESFNGPLGDLLEGLEGLEKLTKSSPVTITLESVSEIYQKIAKAELDIIDASDVLTLTERQAVEYQAQKIAAQGGQETGPVVEVQQVEYKPDDQCKDCPDKPTCPLTE